MRFWAFCGVVALLGCEQVPPVVNITVEAGNSGGTAATGGSGGDGQGAPAGAGGTASSSTSVGGQAGGGGAGLGSGGDAGGGPCVPLACEAIHGACGLVSDGCEGTIDCTRECNGGTEPVYSWCGEEGLCVCMPYPVSEYQHMCDTAPGAVQWCTGHAECKSYVCGDPATTPDAQLNCKALGVPVGCEFCQTIGWCCWID